MLKSVKARKEARARIDLQRLCPKGTTIFCIERSSTDNSVTFDVFKLNQLDNGSYEKLRLNIIISEAGLFRLTKQNYVRVGGSQFDHSHWLVTRLADFVWQDEQAFHHVDLG